MSASICGGPGRSNWGNGKRYKIATGLNDTKADRAVADFHAKSIERDLVNRLFDPCGNIVVTGPKPSATGLLIGLIRRC
jgi:hypothetical protein